MEATQGVAKELLGDSMALLDIEEATLRRQLAEADQLVRDALESLRAAHSARKASENLAAKILDAIFDEAWCEIKLRREWGVREDWLGLLGRGPQERQRFDAAQAILAISEEMLFYQLVLQLTL